MSVTQAGFEPLLTLLDMQMNVNRQLLMLAEEQRQSIINNQVEKLDALVKQQSALLRQLTGLEKKRLEAAANLHACLGLPDRLFTLSELIPYAPPQQQPGLHSLLNEFASLLTKLKDTNDANKLLLQTNIDLNDLLLNLLSDDEAPLNNLYRVDGRKAAENPATPNLFDHQV